MEETLNNNDQNNYLIVIVVVSTKSKCIYTNEHIMGTPDVLMRRIRGKFPRGLEGQVGATWGRDSVERTAVQRP